MLQLSLAAFWTRAIAGKAVTMVDKAKFVAGRPGWKQAAEA